MSPTNEPRVTSLADGFRRVVRAPGAAEVNRARALLTEAARGQGRAIVEGLAVLGTWENASTIAGLLPAGALGARGASGLAAGSRRVWQRALRALGGRLTPPAALAAAARGAPARVRGRVLRSRRKVVSHIWWKGEISDHNVRLLVEEGHDFFLSGPDGVREDEVLVLAAGGWCANGLGTAIDMGDAVEVWGFVDRLVEHASCARSSKPRGEPIALSLRARDDCPLVLRKIDSALATRVTAR